MDLVFNIFWAMFGEALNQWIMSIFTMVLGLVTMVTTNFWNHSIIVGLISFCQWVGRGLFFCSLIIMIFDIVEDLGANKPVSASTIVGNLFKGLVFIEAAPYIGKYSLLICDQLLVQLNLSSYITSGAMPIGAWILIITLIALVYFLVKSLQRFGSMLVQVCTCALYLPSIMRGDTTAMGSWGRQTISIALTYLFQYILFYLGFFFMMNSNMFVTGLSEANANADFVLACGMWLTMGSIPKILDKFGWSAGTGGALSSAGNFAMQGAQMLIR